MNYVLFQNKQSVLLGPFLWKPRFIQAELDDLDVDFTVSPAEPGGYLKISDELEIYPAQENEIPPYDSKFYQLSGPFWDIREGTIPYAVATYQVVDRSIESIQGHLKGLVASERYKREVSGIKITIQGTEVSISTDRDSRNVFAQKLLSMSEGETSQWKFAQAWLTLTKEEFASILSAITTHVQTQYDWELQTASEIDSKQTVEELKAIDIVGQPGTL